MTLKEFVAESLKQIREGAAGQVSSNQTVSVEFDVVVSPYQGELTVETGTKNAEATHLKFKASVEARAQAQNEK